MDKKYRIRKNVEFKQVYSGGKNYWNRNLTLYVKRNNLDGSRYGITITKKIGSAVVRNRIRRRIKEIYRLNFYRIKDGYDLVFIPKKNVQEISYKQLESALIHILKISHMLKD